MLAVSRARRRVLMTSGITGVLSSALVFTLVAGAALLTGGAAVAADTSEVTVSAKDQDADYLTAPFPDLKVTISQTTELEAQGVVLSWTGARQSTVPSQQIGGSNFLQVFQCWGDDPLNPGTPDRTTCQYGVSGVPGSTRDSVRENDASVAPEDAQYTSPGDGFANPTYTSIPYRAVDGTTVASVVDNKQVAVDVNSHQFFTRYTTNMVPWAGSGMDGSGSVKFELQTAMQSKGLGCGAPVEAADQTVTPRSCWLVIVPRGDNDSGSQNITQSGLFWDAWKHRLAVRLDFKLLGTRCPIGTAERQLAGSELISRAIASWQPVICNTSGGSVYSAITSAESDAALAANGVQPAPLALTSRALSPDLAKDSLRYAPVAISGAAISFAIDRNPRPGDQSVPEDIAGRSGLPFTGMKLTPRLVAKLLTNSYLDSLPTRANRDHVKGNPRTLTYDPDFLDVNKDDPDWAYQALASPSLASVTSPLGRSDVAWAMWQYAMSDQSGRDFLSGIPDPWGMRVNPWSATDAKANSTGTALALPREDFPKADPIEQEGDATSGPVNLVTWRPYVGDLDAGAYATLRGDGQILGAWDPLSVPPKYGKADRSLPGRQAVLAVTDTASAARYQVVTAALLNPAGAYVTATPESMTAAAAAMTAQTTQAQVYAFDPTSSSAIAASGAYPLTMPIYAAVNPLMKDAGLRASYAAFIRFAATSGQDIGTNLGQLPEGYAPLPAGWRSAATAAADDIQSGIAWAAPMTPAASTPSNASAFPAAKSPVVATPVVVAASPTTGTIAASGVATAVLSGATTPADPDTGVLAAAVPVSLLGGVACAAAVPLVTRIRRRI